MTLDPLELRAAFGTFMTGVTVVATRDGEGQPRGFTANSFTSVSLDPPLLAVCVAVTAHSAGCFREADGFSVSVLADSQIETSNLFASKRPDKFRLVEWSDGPAGHPVLTSSLSWFDCRTANVVEAGDHFILIGAVAGFHVGTGNPLGFARGGYVAVDREREVLTSPSDVTIGVSAIVEHRGRIWMQSDGDGRAILPRRELRRGESALGAIREMLRISGCDAEVGFLFAVYDRDDGAGQEIVYRASAETEQAAGGTWLEFEPAIAAVAHDPTLQRMLTRFSQEHATQGFGVYSGPAEGGDVRFLA